MECVYLATGEPVRVLPVGILPGKSRVAAMACGCFYGPRRIFRDMWYLLLVMMLRVSDRGAPFVVPSLLAVNVTTLVIGIYAHKSAKKNVCVRRRKNGVSTTQVRCRVSGVTLSK